MRIFWCLKVVLFFFVFIFFNMDFAKAGNMTVHFILDGSGSMWGRIDGVEKIVIAKSTLIDLVQRLPEHVSVGLTAYGHRKKGDCSDIETLIRPEKNDRGVMVRHIVDILPRGKTPLSKSIDFVAQQLDTSTQSIIVLVTDGKETCTGNPCDLVKALKESGARFVMHVVGFDVTAEEKEQLACIAAAGGGQYYQARDALALESAFKKVEETWRDMSESNKPGILLVTGSGTDLYEVYQKDGKTRVTFTNTSRAVELPPGNYQVKLGNKSRNVTVVSGEKTEIGTGSILVTGSGKALYAAYEATGQQKLDFTRTNRAIELLSGTYQIELCGTRRVVTVETGRETVVETATVTVSGPGNNLYEVYDATGEKKLEFTYTNKPVELLPGIYKVKKPDGGILEITLKSGDEIIID